jgi:hypothetical protein
MMSTLLTGECLIALVETLGRTEEYVLAGLHTKRYAKLACRNPDWAEIYQRLEDSHHRRVPIGIWLDRDDRIVDAAWAERDFLLSITEQGAKPGWVWVYFATGGSYPLRKSNPDYERIEEAVRRCREMRSPAWLVTTTGPEGVELVDLQMLEPEEDALLRRISNLGWG